ncbi:MAG: protein arginine kinase [Verrucomicrobiaceae bacterium]|nr:protein arginine kinase [Verrucomicrobiaceae bacterium]
MQFKTILNNPAEWMLTAGPLGEIVISSRIRLARNLSGFSFPGWAAEDVRMLVLDSVKPTVDTLSEMRGAFSSDLRNLSTIRKQVLVERHLISREQAAKGTGSAVVMNRKQTLCIMINEEDHLRMQSIKPGLNLKSAFNMIDKIDTKLEENIDYAFDNQHGYLTACPTNLGTGMRASAMLHLPALVLSEQINQVIQAVNKIGLAVRGLYGEGTEALGNLFQVSNQHTLGEKEIEIVARLEKVIRQIIEHEKNARATLFEERRSMLDDKVGRAYAILRHGHIISTKEALELLSMLRAGVDLGYFPDEVRGIIDVLFMEIQPAHLQMRADSKLGVEERDILRAEIMRDELKILPEPGKLPQEDQESENNQERDIDEGRK